MRVRRCRTSKVALLELARGMHCPAQHAILEVEGVRITAASYNCASYKYCTVE